jgi:predicted Zn-dependent protease
VDFEMRAHPLTPSRSAVAEAMARQARMGKGKSLFDFWFYKQDTPTACAGGLDMGFGMWW